MELIETLPLSLNLSGVPRHVLVLPLGHVSSEKGDFIVDGESFQMIQGNMQRRAIDIVVDYEHQTLTSSQAPASGWVKGLSLGNDGIYAEVEWTNRAKSFLSNKEYRYISPVVLVRKSDRKVSLLHSIALTNTPAINGMVPIVNSFGAPAWEGAGMTQEQRQICQMLNISEADFVRYGNC